MDQHEQHTDPGKQKDQGKEGDRRSQKRLGVNEALCPDCGVQIGQPHQPQCDVARCEICGGQRLSCGCGEQGHDQGHEDVPWGGDWPGAAECRRRGWWARMVPGEGWCPCVREDHGATEDLNRLAFLQAEGFDGMYDRTTA